MKKTIAATVLTLTAAAAHAGPFAFERQIGAEALFPTVATDGYVAPNSGMKSSPVFTHERDFGHKALYPTLVSEEIETNVRVGDRPADTGSELVHIWNMGVEVGG